MKEKLYPTFEEAVNKGQITIKSIFPKDILESIEPFCWTCSEIDNDCKACPFE